MSRKRNHNKQFERKVLPVLVTEVDEAEGTVEAIVAVMGNIDDGLDIIHNGSFTKTITERAKRIKVLDHHNTWSVRDVIGMPIAMREIGRDELPEELLGNYPGATGGLWTKTKYLLDTPEGKGAFERIKAGAITEYSIGFEVIQSDYSRMERGDGSTQSVRNIREIRLWEYSPVIWGMNPATQTVGVKEYMPDGSHRQLLGDALKAAVHGKFVGLTAYYYSEGYLSSAEYAELMTLSTDLFNLLENGIPQNIADRELDPYFWWSADAETEQKTNTATPEVEPAGPPVSEDETKEAPTLDEQKLLQEIDLGLAEIDLSEASQSATS